MLHLDKKDNLEVYGNDWDTPDGTCIRDYIHVMDVSEGHIKTLRIFIKKLLSIYKFEHWYR